MNYRHLIRTLSTIKRSLRSVLEENAELERMSCPNELACFVIGGRSGNGGQALS